MTDTFRKEYCPLTEMQKQKITNIKIIDYMRTIMKVKTFEIRDRATFIPVAVIKLKSDGNEKNRYLLRRSGLDSDESYQIAMIDLNAGYGLMDAYEWPSGSRTFPIAHEYIEKHFDELETGSVVDVEFILGETTEIKKSEKFTAFGLDE